MTSPIPYPRNLIEQNFGLCIAPEDLIFPFYYHSGGNYCRPWRWFNQTGLKDSGSTIEQENNIYKITLDVQHFKPEEINVRVNENQIIIEANHEEKQDEHGYISRHFKRRYVLPYDCLTDTVECTLSSDGILILTVRKIDKVISTKEIIVPIQICGASAKATQSKVTSTTKIIANETKSNQGSIEVENSKDKQIMLNEDHCRLLKPELLGPAVSESKRKETGEQITEELSAKSKTGQTSASIKVSSLETTSEEAIETRSKKEVSDKICDNFGGVSITDVSDSEKTIDLGELSSISKELNSQAVSVASSSVAENSTQIVDSMNAVGGAMSKTQEIMEILETSSAKASASATTQEKFEEMTMEFSESKISEGMSSSQAKDTSTSLASSTIEEMIEKCSADLAEIANKYSDSGFTRSSERTDMKSMSYSSSEVQESSFSSSTSMSMKATGESATMIMTDVIAELKEAAESNEK